MSRALVRTAALVVAAIALIAAGLQFSATSVDAAGPPYDGPQTQPTGPAFFGPAPNPFPYCENPTYFDPFPENVNPIGRIDVTGAPNASVTTDGITMDFELTAEGSPGTQYPGFFQAPDGEGSPTDQPKGVEMAFGDAAVISLSEPLFYTQWVFTDIDRANEGFDVTPLWTDAPAQVAVFGGNSAFDFAGTTTTLAQFNDTDTVGEASESLNGRVQVDLLGAVTGISIVRDPGSGQSGFAIGGGCSPIGVAKTVASGPTWNPALGQFEVTYSIVARNNLPSTATLAADVDAALAAAASGFTTGTPTGIDLLDIQLTDLLTGADFGPAFANVTVVDLTSLGGLAVNDAYDGDADVNLLAPGVVIPPETEETFELVLTYEPVDAGPLDPVTCAASYSLLNQAELSGTASGVAVEDLSDDGVDPDPGVDNGAGGVDDPTVVVFDCPPPPSDPVLEIVKTVVPGPAGTCPSFAGGVPGVGTPLDVVAGDTVTYCIAVQNTGAGTATNVVVSDPQAPAGFDGTIGDLAAGAESAPLSFDLVVDANTPTTNTASVTGDGPAGPLPPVTDDAAITVAADPVLEIVKTVVPGPAGTCPDFAGGVVGDGAALQVVTGDTVTYCITVLNSGNGEATNVVVSDAQAPAGFDGTIGTLAAGAEATVSFDLTVDENTPTQNTASVTGDGPAGPLAPVVDTAVIDVPPEPVLEIVKTVVVGPNGTCPAFAAGVPGDGAALGVTSGDTVTYCISVLNSGAGDATNVVVSDAQAPAGFDGTIGDLAAGAEATVSFDLEVTLATPTQNTASVTGEGPGGPLAPVDDTAVIDVSRPVGVIQVTKTVIPSALDCTAAVEGVDELVVEAAGTDIIWCFVVTNIGTTDLAQIRLNDAPAGLADVNVLAEFGGGAPSLAPGASIVFELPATIPAPGVVNTVDVTALPARPDGSLLPDGLPTTDNNDAEVGSVGIDLDKTVVAGPNGDCQTAVDLIEVPVGATVTYCFTVTNTGSTALSVTSVEDATLAVSVPVPAAQQVIAANGSVTVSIDVVAADLVNTASVTGTPVDPAGQPIPGAPQPTATDDAEVVTLTPELDLVKTVVAGPNGTCPADLAAGIDGDGPALPVLIGDTVTYCINVANVGEIAIDNVVVSDPMAPAGFDGAVGTLEIGAEAAVSFDLLVVSDTPAVNTAAATGDDPATGNPLPPTTDTAVIDQPAPDPQVQLTKTVIEPDGSCENAEQGVDEFVLADEGDPIIWCFVVTNVGNVPLTTLMFQDGPAGVADLDVLADHGEGRVVLLVGDSISFEIPSTVPDGGLDNVATVSGLAADPDGTPIDGVDPVDDIDDAAVDELQAELAIVKDTTAAVGVAAGSVIPFTLTITNNGPHAAEDVMVVDALPDGLELVSLPVAAGWACTAVGITGIDCARAEPMPNGVTESLSYLVRVSATAPEGEALINRATVSSSTEDPDPTNNEDTEETTRREPPPAPPLLPGTEPLDPVTITTAPPPAPPVPVTAPPSLAFTGSSSSVLASVAMALLAMGAALNVASRRAARDDE